MERKHIALQPLEELTREVGVLTDEIKPLEEEKEKLGEPYKGGSIWNLPLKDRLEHGNNFRSVSRRLKSLEESTGYRKKNGWAELLRRSEELGSTHADTLNEFPDFLTFVWDLSENSRQGTTVASFTADAGNGIGVVLTDELHFGGPGTEYGVGVTAYRNGKTERKYFVTTPSTSWDHYDHLNFRKARILDVTDDGFSVELITSSCGSQKVEYKLRRVPASERVLDDVLDETEQEAFVAQVDALKEELVGRHYKENARMSRQVQYFQSQSVILQGELDLSESVPYEQPQIVDVYIQKQKGIAVVIVKAQIDHDIARGLQHELVAYAVTSEGETVLDRKCAYDADVQRGNGVSLNAQQLCLKHLEKASLG